MVTATQLIEFEREMAAEFAAATIHAPVHFCGGNEAALLEIFTAIPPTAYVFSTWRSHYHALLHGVPMALVREAIRDGHSMNMNFPEYRFFSSAIVGGTLPIACGVAAAGHEVWVFVGDMTASLGAFADAQKFAIRRNLPVHFVIEDNGLATNTPTDEAWGMSKGERCSTIQYQYTRVYPHVGLTTRVEF